MTRCRPFFICCFLLLVFIGSDSKSAAKWIRLQAKPKIKITFCCEERNNRQKKSIFLRNTEMVSNYGNHYFSFHWYIANHSIETRKAIGQIAFCCTHFTNLKCTLASSRFRWIRSISHAYFSLHWIMACNAC